MSPWTVFGSLLLASTLGAVADPPPLACRLDALTDVQRERHRRLTGILERSVAQARELPRGYELTLDLSRLPKDAKGDPICVVEVAEWVDLESRCCPFLEFGIDVRGTGGPVRLTLTGGPGVKDFLRGEFPLLEENLKSQS